MLTRELGFCPQGREEHLKSLKQPFPTKFSCMEDGVERDETRASKTKGTLYS